MADSVVTFALERLQIKDQEWIAGMKENLGSLSDELLSLPSILKDFEVTHSSDISVNLGNAIRDLAYDAEDILDDYVVWDLEEKRKISWRYLPGFRKNKMIKRSITKRIEEFKKTMEEINANEGNSVRKRALEVTAPEDSSILEEANLAAFRNSTETAVPGFKIETKADVVGFMDETDILVKRLIGGGLKCAAISIVGMGGLGKTTLAKKIYNHAFIERSFKHRAWVYVSQKNRPGKLVLSILTLPSQEEEIKEVNVENFGMVLHEYFKGKKYLIVMDDVRKPQIFEKFRLFFPDDNNGSRILLTTRVTEVALLANSDQMNPPHCLRFLDNEESWVLFCMQASLGENCSREWEELGRQIAKKCGGLPLAIIQLGSLLAESRREYNELSRLANRVSTLFSQRPVKPYQILILSYHELPHYLKPCFLYFCTFPESCQIPARNLIQLWVAEGFIQENDEETMENTAERYLEMLVDQGLIQVLQRRSDGGVKTCSIHDILHVICISEAQQEEFLQVHGYATYPPQFKSRRLAGNANAIIEYIRANADSVTQVRSLLCFTDKSEAVGVWSNLFKLLRFLRVFKASDIGGVVPAEVENLIHLRYLGLGSNSRLEVPSSICNLLSLQVLDARLVFDDLSAPVEIWNLKKLRHLYFHGPTFLPQPPESPSSSFHNDSFSLLKDLQTLSTISANSCTPEVFAKVPNLLKLGVKGDLNHLSRNLARLEHLQTLKLARVESAPPLVSLPLGFPPNLSKLTLCDTQLIEDPMPLLGELRNLLILKLLGNVYSGNKMLCSAKGFPRLQHLKLLSLEHVCDLVAEEGALSNLHHLVIHDCKALQRFTGLSNLTSLQVVNAREPLTELRQLMELFVPPQQLHIYPPKKIIEFIVCSFCKLFK